jgi:hypothetical protein
VTVRVRVGTPIETAGLAPGERNLLIERVRLQIAAMLVEPVTAADRSYEAAGSGARPAR